MARIIDSAIDSSADVLDEITVDPVVDRADFIILVNLNYRFFHALSLLFFLPLLYQHRHI